MNKLAKNSFVTEMKGRSTTTFATKPMGSSFSRSGSSEVKVRVNDFAIAQLIPECAYGVDRRKVEKKKLETEAGHPHCVVDP